MDAAPSSDAKSAHIKTYKNIFRDVLDRRPSGTRQQLATALGKNRSFISQISHPSYAAPIPARHLDIIFKICRFSTFEKNDFLGAFILAHPNKLMVHQDRTDTRVLNLTVFDSGVTTRNREFDGLVREALRRLEPIMKSPSRRANSSSGPGAADPARALDEISCRTGSKADRIYSELRAMIVTGDLPPGIRLDMKKLRDEHSSSRLPIAVALDRLAHEGLIVIRPQYGSFVAPIHFDDIRQFMLLRLSLETEAIDALMVSAEREAFLDFASFSLAYQRAAVAISDLRRFYELDVEMHRTMIIRSGLPKYNRVLADVSSHLERVGWLTRTIPDCANQTLSEHEAIIEAIASGRPMKARTALREHLASTWRSFERVCSGVPAARNR
jgi:GntR family transcriptional regulator, rspAB operon transcriptional repressor